MHGTSGLTTTGFALMDNQVQEFSKLNIRVTHLGSTQQNHDGQGDGWLLAGFLCFPRAASPEKHQTTDAPAEGQNGGSGGG